MAMMKRIVPFMMPIRSCCFFNYQKLRAQLRRCQDISSRKLNLAPWWFGGSDENQGLVPFS